MFDGGASAGAAAATPTAVSPSELQSAMRAKLSTDPGAGSRIQFVQAIQARQGQLRASVNTEREQTVAWEKQNGGISSMARVGAGVAKMGDNLVNGHFAFWDGAGKTITRAETFHPAPQHARIEQLSRQLEECTTALQSLADGKPLPSSATDYRLAELEKGISTPAEMMDGRLARLREDVEKKDAPAGVEHFGATVDAFLGAALPSGESVLVTPSGKPSVTAVLNQLADAGVLEAGGKLLCTGDDVKAVAGKLKEAQGRASKVKDPVLAGALRNLSSKDVDAEGSRLLGLERKGDFKALLPKLLEARALLKTLQQRTQPGFWEKALRSGLSILDSPETWAMMAIGAGVSGRVGSAVFGKLGMESVSAGELGALAKGGQLSAGAVGRFAATTSIDAAAFQTAMNGFNIARGKSDRAGWSPGDYARTALLFGALGGVRANALRREAAVTTAGRAARGAQYLGEEAGTMTLLAEGENLIRHGNLDGAADVLTNNFEFLLAMRAVGGLQTLHPVGRNGDVKDLLALERQARAANATMEKQRSPENVQRMAQAFRAYALKFQELSQGYVARGVAPRAQQVIRTQTHVVPAAEFQARLEAAKGMQLKQAQSPEELALREARFSAIERDQAAFFDPATGETILNEGVARRPEADLALKHEYSHQLFNTLDSKSRAALKAGFEKDPATWAAIRADFDAQAGHHGKLTDERVLDEVMAEWNGATDAQVEAVPLLQKVNSVLTASADGETSLVNALQLDLRGLTGAAARGLAEGRAYNNTTGELDPIGLTVPLYTGPAAFDFPGAGLFEQALNARLGNPAPQEAAARAQSIYNALFGRGRGDAVSVYKAIALADPTLRESALGTLEAFSKNIEQLFPPGRSEQFYLDRLATLPFLAGAPEARRTFVDAVNLKAQNRSQAIKGALDGDLALPPSQRRAVWDAVFVGAGPHSQAAITAFKNENPNARVLVVDAGKTVSQFSDTGEAFYVNSSGYSDTGEPAKPASGKGDLNPLDGPAVVTDLASLKYGKGKDIGDSAAVNLDIAGPDTLLEARVRDDGIEDVSGRGFPAKYRLKLEDSKTGESYEVFTNRGAIATGIPSTDLSRFDPETQAILSQGLAASEGKLLPGGDVAQATAGRAAKNIQTGQQFLASFGTDGDPLAPYRGKKTLLIGFGDSGFVTLAQLKGALSAPDTSAITYGRRQLGDVGPVDFATGKSGPRNQAEFAQVLENAPSASALIASFGALRAFANIPKAAIEVQSLLARLRTADPEASLELRIEAASVLGRYADNPQTLNSGATEAAFDDALNRARTTVDGFLSGARRFRYIDLGGTMRGRDNDTTLVAGNVLGVRTNGEGYQAFFSTRTSDALEPVARALEARVDPQSKGFPQELGLRRQFPEAVEATVTPRAGTIGAIHNSAAEFSVAFGPPTFGRPSLKFKSADGTPYEIQIANGQPVVSYGSGAQSVVRANLAVLAESDSRFRDLNQAVSTSLFKLAMSGGAGAQRLGSANLAELAKSDLRFQNLELAVNEFSATLTPLKAFSTRFSLQPGGSSVLDLEAGVSYSIERAEDGAVRLIDSEGRTYGSVTLDGKLRFAELRNADKIILTSGQKTNTGKLLSGILPAGTDPNAPLEQNEAVAQKFSGNIPGFEEPVDLGRKIVGQDWWLIGPATGNVVPKDQLANQKENVASLYNLVPRSGEVGRLLARKAAAAPVTTNLDADIRTDPILVTLTQPANTASVQSFNLAAETPVDRLERRPPSGLQMSALKSMIAMRLQGVRFVGAAARQPLRIELRQDGTPIPSDPTIPVTSQSKELTPDALQTVVGRVASSPEIARTLRDVLNVRGQGLELTIPVDPVTGFVSLDRVNLTTFNQAASIF